MYKEGRVKSRSEKITEVREAGASRIRAGMCFWLGHYNRVRQMSDRDACVISQDEERGKL